MFLIAKRADKDDFSQKSDEDGLRLLQAFKDARGDIKIKAVLA